MLPTTRSAWTEVRFGVASGREAEWHTSLPDKTRSCATLCPCSRRGAFQVCPPSALPVKSRSPDGAGSSQAFDGESAVYLARRQVTKSGRFALCVVEFFTSFRGVCRRVAFLDRRALFRKWRAMCHSATFQEQSDRSILRVGVRRDQARSIGAKIGGNSGCAAVTPAPHRQESPASDRFRDGKVARKVPEKLPKPAKGCHFPRAVRPPDSLGGSGT